MVVDLARSVDFRDGHIPGALWGVRTRLDVLRPQLAGARACGADLARRRAGPAGGGRGEGSPSALTQPARCWCWKAAPRLARLRPAAGQGSHEPARRGVHRRLLRPYDRNSGIEDAMKAYLTWEIELVRRIERDETVRSGVEQAAA